MARAELDSYRRGSGLVEILDRVLDKGLVVAGDVKISLADVELLTIRIRLLVCSIDKAQAIGLDWWRHDPYLHGDIDTRREIERLRAHVAELEARLAGSAPGRLPRRRRPRTQSKRRR